MVSHKSIVNAASTRPAANGGNAAANCDGTGANYTPCYWSTSSRRNADGKQMNVATVNASLVSTLLLLGLFATPLLLLLGLFATPLLLLLGLFAS